MTGMALTLQPSLFDPPDSPDAGSSSALAGRLRRTTLTRGAWVDHCPGWLTGADEVFLDLLRSVPWQAERRQMYDRVVDVPRLLAHYGAGEPLPHPRLTQVREELSDHYEPELGERFVTSGLCLYRDGRDSVAWHGDRIGRGRTTDTMVAILSLGEPRRLQLRPNPDSVPSLAGLTRTFTLGHGDLLVMGGSCQRTWEHAVPKSSTPCGPRISVQLRPRGVL
nr:alpha-ketoglutarate-dependent dioxygenase AlkB [Nocardioides sp. HDW12B]